MLHHWRTGLYLLAAALIWFAEDYVFTRGLGFNAGQTAVVTVYFVGLFAAAMLFVQKTMQRLAQTRPGDPEDIPITRILAMAPVLTVILGSFAALPIIILVLLAGSVL